MILPSSERMGGKIVRREQKMRQAKEGKLSAVSGQLSAKTRSYQSETSAKGDFFHPERREGSRIYCIVMRFCGRFAPSE
jgi:hypothetical protein